MKKLAALFLILALFSSAALAEVPPVPLIVSGFCFYAESFGANDILWEVEGDDVDDETCSMSVDYLTIYYGRNTFTFDWGVLIVGAPGASDLNDDLRALALFAIMEYGQPDGDTSLENVKKARAAAMPAYRELQSTLKKYDDIKIGQFYPFYIGDQFIYSIYKYDNGFFAIIVE